MRKLAASILLAIAGILALFESIALIDPVGTKMADDLDPFGDPNMAWYQHAELHSRHHRGRFDCVLALED